MDILRIFMSFTGTFAFSLLFNIRGKKLVFASVAGLVCGLSYYISGCLSEREIFAYFMASVCVTVYAEITARFVKAPATSFLAPGIIPLVPGGALYYTMSAALHGNAELFFERGMETVYIALAIAAGILVISPIKAVFGEIKLKNNCNL